MESIQVSTQCYVSYMREMMADLLRCPDSADVTIVTDDRREVRAHKAVLKASSGFFKSYLGAYSHSQQNQLVFLRGVNFEELSAILHFIYLGEAQVGSAKIGHFIQVGKELEIKGIGDVEREKIRIENPNLYETVNCENEYVKALSENFADHDIEEKDDCTETIEDETDYDYIQALTNKFESESWNKGCDQEKNPDDNHHVSGIQNLNKSFSEEMESVEYTTAGRN